MTLAASKKGALLTDLILETFRITGEAIEWERKITKQSGITRARWHVLRTLASAEKPLTVAQTARRMGISRQGVQRVVNELVEAQLLKTAYNPDHKRSSLLHMTPQGQALHQEIRELYVHSISDASFEVSAPELEETLDVMKLIREKLTHE